MQGLEQPLRAHAWVIWVKKTEPSQFLIGIKILDCEDFWKLEVTVPKGMLMT